MREELGDTGSWRCGGPCDSGGGTLDPLGIFFLNAEKDDGGC